MEHLETTKTTNKWKVSTVVLALIVAGLIAGVLYFNYQLNLSRGQINQVTSERNEAQRQLAIAKGDTDGSKDNTPSDVTYTSRKGVSVAVSSPAKTSAVTSPLTVSGKVPGSWSHEGQFTVLLKASDGTTVDSSSAKISGDWMTDELVQFSAQLSWSDAAPGNAVLILQKANPSGIEANNDQVEIPITL